MAKEPGKSIPDEELGTVPPPPAPEGGREVTGGQFLNFIKGETADGMLIGVTPIRNQRGELIDRYVLIDADGETKILPDHVDLTRRLAEVVLKTGWGARVWMAYLGKEKVEGVANPMARYEVRDYGLTKAGEVMAKRYSESRGSSVIEEDM